MIKDGLSPLGDVCIGGDRMGSQLIKKVDQPDLNNQSSHPVSKLFFQVIKVH